MHKAFRYSMPLLMATIIVFTACTRHPGSSEDSGANSYYVDSQNGDDNNTGTSEDSPWKTLDKVSSMTFQPGDNIYFKRGSSYEGSVTIN
ncbi:MAG: hypothetical protein GWN67_01950, partial [Phycisphaerae bacterium]|nr:hypothetical protein [Phycisphaerae bacterium]NIW48191.1 hypothetical protein [Gammaproteobacteria bacterium]